MNRIMTVYSKFERKIWSLSLNNDPRAIFLLHYLFTEALEYGHFSSWQ